MNSICHQHLWIIESPNGPKSEGKCKLCGEVKEFDNYIKERPDIAKSRGRVFTERSNDRFVERR